MLTDDTFELWDYETRNLIATFPTVEAALAVIRAGVASYGEESMLNLGLGGEDERGDDVLIAEGRGLIRLAIGQDTPEPS